MANARFTIRKRAEILGNFYSSESGDLTRSEKLAICDLLNRRLTGDIFFESTSFAVSDAFLPPKPDFTNKDGRKFWVYLDNLFRLKDPGHVRQGGSRLRTRARIALTHDIRRR